MAQLDPIPTTIVLLASLTAAVTDLWLFKVHDILTLPLLLSGLIYNGVIEGIPGLAGSMLSALIGFGLLAVFWLLGGVGAGDVKLLAGIGAWLRMPLTLYVFLSSSLVAGIYALVLILVFGSPRESWARLKLIGFRVVTLGRRPELVSRVQVEVNRSDRRKRVIPFAFTMFFGIVALMIWSWLGAAD